MHWRSARQASPDSDAPIHPHNAAPQCCRVPHSTDYKTYTRHPADAFFRSSDSGSLEYFHKPTRESMRRLCVRSGIRNRRQLPAARFADIEARARRGISMRQICTASACRRQRQTQRSILFSGHRSGPGLDPRLKHRHEIGREKTHISPRSAISTTAERAVDRRKLNSSFSNTRCM